MSKLLEDGYQVFPNVVSRKLLNAVVADVRKFTEHEDPTNLAYRSGLVEMYHFQSMWDIRQHPAVHEVFAELHGTEKLWVGIDRVCFKPANGIGGFMHWDENIHQRPRPFLLQGLVALNDQPEDSGGFHCLPDLYRGLDNWLSLLPRKKATRSSFSLVGASAIHADGMLGPWPVVRVPLKAGDLLVWHSFLPHGNGANHSDVPRICQYITMTKVGDERTRQERINCWETNETPSGWAFPGDPRRIEQARKGTADLTTLGRKLLGSEKWE